MTSQTWFFYLKILEAKGFPVCLYVFQKSTEEAEDSNFTTLSWLCCTLCLQQCGSCRPLAVQLFLLRPRTCQRVPRMNVPFCSLGSTPQRGALDNIVSLCAHSVWCDPSSSFQLAKAEKTSDDSFFNPLSHLPFPGAGSSCSLSEITSHTSSPGDLTVFNYNFLYNRFYIFTS